MIHPLIHDRKSTVLFSAELLSDETVNELFEAARWASSSRNEQPWRFVYAKREDDFFTEMLTCINESNQLWAKNASLLLVSMAKKKSDYTNQPNKYSWHDTALAFASLVFQAQSVGLSVHPMGGYSADDITKTLGLSENFEPVIFAAVGKISDKLDFPEILISKENRSRDRKLLSEIAFRGRPESSVFK